MENFDFQCGTRIIFGRDTEKQAGELVKQYGKTALLLYGGGSIKKRGFPDPIYYFF